MNIAQLLEHCRREMNLDPLDAELLLALKLGQARSYLHSRAQQELSPRQIQEYLDLAERRRMGEPLAYITGEKEFWSLRLKVNRHTLIPRPETEVLVEQVLERIPRDSAWNILDLGTGSGAIALAIAKERPLCRVLASDMDERTLAVASENIHSLALSNITLIQSDLFLNIDGIFNIIISNPPYVEKGDPHLQQLRYEPERALIAEDQGLGIIKAICHQARDYLTPQGILALEHGYNQSKRVQEILATQGFTPAPFQDYSGHWRGVIGQLK